MMIKNALCSLALILCFISLDAQPGKIKTDDTSSTSKTNTYKEFIKQAQERILKEDVYLQNVTMYDSLHLLCKTNPENLSYKTNLNDVCLNFYRIHIETFNYDKALKFAQESHDLLEQLRQKEPDNHEYKGRICKTYYEMSHVELLLKNNKNAILYANKALNLSKEIYESAPTDFVSMWNYYSYLTQLIDLYLRIDEYEKTLPFLKRSEVLSEEILNVSSDIEMQIVRLRSLFNTAFVHLALGDIDKAIQGYLEVHKALENIISSHSSNIEFTEISYDIYQSLGNAYLEMGDTENAIFFLKKAVILKEQTQRRIASSLSYRDLGNAYFARNDFNKADFFYQKFYNESGKNAILNSPNNITFFAQAHMLLGKVATKKGDLDEALRLYKEAKEKMEMVLEAFPEMNNSPALTESYSLLGEYYFTKENFNLAYIFYYSSHKELDSLYQQYPKNPNIKRLFAVSCRQLGEVQSALKDNDKAISLLQKDLQLTQELCTAYPQHIRFKQELADGHHVMGVFYKEQDKLKAREHLNKSFDICEELASTFPDNPKLQEAVDWSKKALESTY